MGLLKLNSSILFGIFLCLGSVYESSASIVVEKIEEGNREGYSAAKVFEIRNASRRSASTLSGSREYATLSSN